MAYMFRFIALCLAWATKTVAASSPATCSADAGVGSCAAEADLGGDQSALLQTAVKQRVEQDCNTPLTESCEIQTDVTPACCEADKNQFKDLAKFCSTCADTANVNIAANVKASCEGNHTGSHTGLSLMRTVLTPSGSSTDVCTKEPGDCFVKAKPQNEVIFKGKGILDPLCPFCCSTLAPIVANVGPISKVDTAKFCGLCRSQSEKNVDLAALYTTLCAEQL